jgi:hypothetical protein
MTWVQWIAVVVGGTLAILFLSKCADAAECRRSASAVLAAGAHHAAWIDRDGSKCWFAGYPQGRKHGIRNYGDHNRAANPARIFGEVVDSVRHGNNPPAQDSYRGVPLPRPRYLTDRDTIWSEFDSFAKEGER